MFCKAVGSVQHKLHDKAQWCLKPYLVLNYVFKDFLLHHWNRLRFSSMFVSNQYHSDHTPFINIVKTNKERSSMTEFVTIATALSLIHSQKEASQLIIVDWETNTFETHFQIKNYRNYPRKYNLNFRSKHKRKYILKLHSSQMVLCC